MFASMFKTKRIFLDYASTTPVDKAVLKTMLPFQTVNFGNASALYKEGVYAKQVLAQARTAVASQLNVKASEIVFTASGTEADNLAVRGIFDFYKSQFKPHIITSVIEHPGILEICKYIEHNGGEVTYVPVNEAGLINPQDIKAALKPETVLVTIMLANNEIGTIQPIRDIARLIAEYKQANNKETYPYLHTDASQGGNYLDLSFQKLGCDLLTLDASKMYGPKGVGALGIKSYVEIKPIIYGGGQEKGLRSATENIAGIVGLAKALNMAQKIRDKEARRLKKLQTYFFKKVTKVVPNVIINGDREKRLPNNVNFCIPKLDAEFAVIKLDQKGIACSSASSCINLSENSYSYVVDALGPEGKACRESSLRFTFGRDTTKKHLKVVLKLLPTLIQK